MIFLFLIALPALIALGTSLLVCEIGKDKWQPYKRREEVLETPEERNAWYKPHEEVPAKKLDGNTDRGDDGFGSTGR